MKHVKSTKSPAAAKTTPQRTPTPRPQAEPIRGPKAKPAVATKPARSGR